MDINSIKPYSRNAKKHPDKQLKQIADSLKEFGWRQSIVVDKNEVIIVGHGRYFAYKKYPDGINEPRIEKADDLTDEQVKAYRLADNKLNESEWSMDLAISELKELDEKLFGLTGFDKEVLEDIEEEVEPEVVFTEELLESHNYVVLYFDNDIDWLNLQTLYPLPKVKGLDSKKGYERAGVGRVIRGVDFIKKLKN